MIRTICLAKPAEVTQWSRAGLLRGNDPRISRLYDAVAEFPSPISLIVFEDVVFASTTYQAQLWASFRAAVWLAAAHRREPITFLPVPVGTLKKFATGNGAADKQAMKAAAERAGFDCTEFDDNAVDAIHLWRYGFTHKDS
jgi:Holliday junction resolvasome RuvABC endonuclease subunit